MKQSEDEGGYIGWYNRQRLWLRILLIPILFPVIFVHGTLMMAVFIFVFVPYDLCQSWLENRRFWERMEERGQAGRWADVEDRINAGDGTLVVEVGPKGPARSWYIDKPLDVVDPMRVVPTWQTFVEGEFEALETAGAQVNVWTIEKLGAFERTAQVVAPTYAQLEALVDDAKRSSVLAVLLGFEGCLSRRYWTSLKSSA